MVLTEWRGTGRAKRLHDALIASVEANAVSLQVESAHEKVVLLYESWGYRQVDTSRSHDDSPQYTVMFKDLPQADTFSAASKILL
ncbi:GNAT family N-acetyltransferase [Streptomyces axinellae]